MFEKKPVNRKRHRKKKSKSRAAHSPDKNTLESLRDREFQLNAQIGELENILASHDRDAERKKTMRQENILPPPETRTRRPDPAILSYSEKRRQQKEQNASGLYFFALLIIASLLAFWLFYSGG
ncbi:MAG: hypothetical protein P1V20_14260 [Verrucomicrobiales bacterium]|nr:hypothetical protein [Verrucomicrobiales bacterium]